MKQYIPLGDIISKASVERCGDGVFPILSITMKDGLVMQDEKFKKRIASVDTTDYKVIRRGKLVQGIHIDEANFGVQDIVDAGIVSPAYKVWDIRTDIIHPQYLEIIMRSPRSLAYYSSKLNGSVNRRGRMTDDDFLSMPIPYTELSDQQKIIDILNRSKALIQNRQKTLIVFDTLIKARFVEMFGDPVINPLRWEQVTLKDVAKGKLSYGSGASATDFDGNLRYIRITDITENGDLNSDRKSPDQFDEKYLLGDGDILFARSGATVGKTFCYAEMKYGKAIYAGYLIRMIPDTSKVLPVYVFYYTKTEYYASFIANAQRAVAQPNINAQEYGDLTICVPPMELQEQFAAFVSQVDKSKSVVQQALAKDQLLFDSLMQKYFG